ncbi:hypothetical protein ABIC55_001475 [Sporosarcina psychrophila]|uniref:Uncharacterized protein n=1 Tax=Sporosarcina psychrophila TaxID=1476 RepID=A0ABV2K5P9_SPOPS
MARCTPDTHPDIPLIIIEVIQSKAPQKHNYTSGGKRVIKLVTLYMLNK